jgi:hypothetical protein
VRTGLKFVTNAVETVPMAVLTHDKGLGWNTMMMGSPKAEPDGPPTATFGGLKKVWKCEYTSNLELSNRRNQETT